MKILLADDERELSRAVSVILQHNNYEVDCAYDGDQAVAMIDAGSYDVFILDIMMPHRNGIEVLRHIRDRGIAAPVIMLTAKAEIDDRIHGLDSGANDYMIKPFAMGELLARIRAATRILNAPPVLKFGNLQLNNDTFELSSGSSSLRLGNLEFEILTMLIKADGREVHSEQFIEKVFDNEGDISEVRLYISYLRKKLDALGSDMIIVKTIYDSYRLERKEP